MRIIQTLLILGVTLMPQASLEAQDYSPTPYVIALQRIEAAIAIESTELDLSGLGLAQIPPELWQLTNLYKLNLFDNQLTSVPPEIGQLTNLIILDLTRNELTRIPSEIEQLSDLQELWLSFNELTSLPPEIGELSSLRILLLTGNQLTSLPPEIGQLQHLVRLWVNDNPLVSPPPEIADAGAPTIVAYLQAEQARLQAEKQRLVIGGAASMGLLMLFALGFRYRQRAGHKLKLKRAL